MFIIFLNFLGIIFGSVIGGYAKKSIKTQYLHALSTAMGMSALVLGIDVALTNMDKSTEPVLFIFSLAIGGLLGTAMKLDRKMETAGKRVEAATKQKAGTPSLAEGITTATLISCIGTLAIMGPILAAIEGDTTLLMTATTLNFVTMIVIGSTYGVGIAFTAVPVLVWYSFFYFVGYVMKDFINLDDPETLSMSIMAETNVVGGILIAAAGLGVLHIKDCKTINLLPSLLVPLVYLGFKSFMGI